MSKAALLIIFEYKNSNISPLPNAKEDLAKIKMLCHRLGIENIYVISDLEGISPEVNNIYNKLISLNLNVSELLIYFSCHGKRGNNLLLLNNGIRVKLTQQILITSILSGYYNNIELKSLDGNRIIKNYGFFPKRAPSRCLIIMDVCHAGSILSHIVNNKRLLFRHKNFYDRITEIVAMSSSSDEKESLAGTISGSAFTNYICEILRNKMKLSEFIETFQRNIPEMLRDSQPIISTNVNSIGIIIPLT